MDENEIEETEYVVTAAKKHDRWSVCVISLNFATQVAINVASLIGDLTEMAAQHKNYSNENDKLQEIAANWRK